MNTKAQLLAMLKDLRSVEISARDSYDQDIITFRNFKIVDTITEIKLDEEKHIRLLTECIDLLQDRICTAERDTEKYPLDRAARGRPS